MKKPEFQFKVGDRIVVHGHRINAAIAQRGEVVDIYALPRDGYRYWIRFDGDSASYGYGVEQSLGGINGLASSIKAYRVNNLEYAL